MQSLQTTVKREAEKMSRKVSVQFDSICEEARLKVNMAAAEAESFKSVDGSGLDSLANAGEVLSNIPALMKLAACRVIEEQQSNPTGWEHVVEGWKTFYEHMKFGRVPPEAQRPAVEAQAILNAIELVLQGKPLPTEGAGVRQVDENTASVSGHGESWASVCHRALAKYRDRVVDSRYKLAQRRLPDVKVRSVTLGHVEAGLVEWCRERLKDVTPRTVKTQLDCMVSTLRCVLPQLQMPRIRELQGVMQPRMDDRQSMPVQAIREAIDGFKQRPASAKVRKGYEGGASQFDAIAVEALAVLGMRPRELIQAKSDSICEKTDVFGVKGLYFRVTKGKNRAAERDIPIGDGARAVLDIDKLRAMLVWQENNPRSPHGAVSSMGSRFREMTNGYTLYQMRHTWVDIARSCEVAFEVHERLMGHRVRGVSTVYGSGIPLVVGLNAIEAVRSVIFGSVKETDNAC